VVGMSISWIYLKSLIKIQDRLIILTFFQMGKPPTFVGLSILRFDLLLFSGGIGEQNEKSDWQDYPNGFTRTIFHGPAFQQTSPSSHIILRFELKGKVIGLRQTNC
jgi:hypothetical protein